MFKDRIVPGDAKKLNARVKIEHERKGDSEEVEFQFKWKR